MEQNKQELWLDEFGEGYRPDAVIEHLLTIAGVLDESWHNNVCPNFRFDLDGGRVIELWFDHPDRNQRELGRKTARYLVCDCPDREEMMRDNLTVAYEGDDADSAVAKFLELSKLPQAVGDKFAKILRRELTASEFDEMRVRNREETDSGTCHSHDFCDANMPMAEAVFVVAGCDPSPENDAATALWNQAWDYAKREHLTAGKR